MRRHILPNVMHLVLIVAVLDFSALVLYEAVLSYVGVGVDPNSSSFGSMINIARNEMSRDPVVWWNLATAFTFMVALVLSANLVADAVREAFDPRARAFRPRRFRLKERDASAPRQPRRRPPRRGRERTPCSHREPADRDSTPTAAWCAPSTRCRSRSSAARPSPSSASRAAASR